MKDKQNKNARFLAYKTPKQHLFYEFANLHPFQVLNIIRVYFDDLDLSAATSIPQFLRLVQDAGRLRELWRVTKNAGGNLGQCPLF